MRHFSTLQRLGTSSLFLLPALAAAAVDAGDRLDPIVVTATRAPQTVDEALSSVTVIEREEIERLQPQQFTDLLRGRAGIGVADNGPFGKLSSVFMRGSNSGHTLLLVDGVRMGSATTGSASWQYLPPSEIERIEIVRGPRTSIYGSDAIGGVIQIFTRKGLEGPPRVNAFVGGGSFNTREFGAGVAGGTRDTRYSVSASRFDTDGIDVLTGVGDDDRDGYDNTSLSGSLSHRLDNGVELFGNLLYSRGTTEFDADETDPATFAVVGPYSPAENDYVHSALRGGVRGFVTPRWQSQLAIAQSRDELDSFEGGTLADRVTYFDTRRDLIDWQNTVRVHADWSWVAGVDAYEDHVDASTAFAEDSRYNVGVYSVLQGALGHNDLEASLRLDDNEQFGSKTTGQLGWGRRLSDAWRVRASAGTAFNAPSFNDLYFPGFSNPDLDPEESRSVEVGARYASGAWFLDAALFQTEIDDLIAFDMTTFSPQNINEARIRGLEVEVGYQAGDWSSRTSLTALEAEDRATGNELPRRSPFSARVDVDRVLGAWSLGGSLLGQARSFNDTANADRLSGFATLDLRAAYAIDPQWTLEASVRNLFDRDYATVRDFTGADYNQPGRGAFVTVRYQQQ
ncbi:TonB-dependent receptor [Thioalkalivibrio sp.]|uniref:TonB-dependent receptor domain-containing protein n=1 Tax=Thioalkalivibrio sp. TaxID=2093813 RepID=UPI0012D57D0D|nr:TonB-dependent receptor [Thioalkalivibrio sp.]TVP76650.1 MAG: TonB-dependent receptor [Thioalkalivibrio sp.]